MGSPVLIMALGLAAALSFALSGTLKHVSAGHVPDAQTLRPRVMPTFIRATVTHRLWLLGIICDVVGLGLQVVALHLGELAVVQPLLISGLLFTLILRARFERRRISVREFIWAVALTAALAGFLMLASNGRPLAHHESVDRLPAVIAGLIGAALTAACIELGRRQRRRGLSSALLGLAVGIVYAGSAAMLKAVTDIAVRSSFGVVLSWQLYAFVVLGAAGLLLSQLAFQAGPIATSLPTTAAIDPLLSIVVGVSVYDEHIRRGPGGGAILVALLLLLGVAIVQLARPPRNVPPIASRAAGIRRPNSASGSLSLQLTTVEPTTIQPPTVIRAVGQRGIVRVDQRCRAAANHDPVTVGEASQGGGVP